MAGEDDINRREYSRAGANKETSSDRGTGDDSRSSTEGMSGERNSPSEFVVVGFKVSALSSYSRVSVRWQVAQSIKKKGTSRASLFSGAFNLPASAYSLYQ